MSNRQLLLFCAIFTATSTAIAQSPRDELLRLAPSDAGFVVIVQDVRGHFDRMSKSPFVTLCMSAAPQKADSPVWKQLAELDEMMKREVGTTLPQLRDDIIGDAIVIIWRPGPPDQPDADQGVVLVRPRHAKMAEGMFEHLDAMQTKSGQLKETSTRNHAGRSYKRRVRNDEPDEFQYQHGNVIAFGSSEAMLKQVIETDVSTEAAPPFAEKLKALNVDGAAIVWWINPRAFDTALMHKQKSVTGVEAAVIQAIGRHWQAIDGVAGFVQLADDMRIGVAVTGRPKEMPESSRRFFSDAARPSSLVESFPKDALLTVSGRIAFPPLMDAGSEILPEAARKQLREASTKTLSAALGPEATDALPNRLGPDWGVCVTAPESISALPTVTAAVRLDDSGHGVPVASRVLDGINALATFTAIGYNANHSEAIALRSDRVGEVEVRYLVGDNALPRGLRPAYAWKQGFLVFASTPEAIAAFRAPITKNSEGPAPLLRAAPSAWAKYLSEHKPALAGLMADGKTMSATEASQRIDSAVQMLKLFSHLDISIDTTADRATITFKIVPAAGLR